MYKWLFCLALLIQISLAFSKEPNCIKTIDGYHVVENTIYPFLVDGKPSCFFAFYTKNPKPFSDVRGDGNLGDSIWYAYYLIDSSKKIYEFPKPADDFWSSVCTVQAVSFIDMNGDGVRDVTVIGACEKNAYNYTFPFVFFPKGNHFVLDEKIYQELYGSFGLTVMEVRHHILSSLRKSSLKK